MKLVGRGDTTVVDAYLSPILRRYVQQVAGELAGVRLMSGRRRVLTTQTSSPPLAGLSVATGTSAVGDASTPVPQQHTNATAVRARNGLNAAKIRKTDTECMEGQPEPRRGLFIDCFQQ